MICGPSRFSTVDQRAERDHLPLRGCGPPAGGCPRARAGTAGRPAPAPGTSGRIVEVVDVGRAERRLERAEDDVERHAQALGLHPVDVGVELRDAGAEGGVQRLQARSAALPSRDHLVGDLLELVRPTPAAVLELHLEAAGDAQALDGRRREGEDRSPPGSRRTAAQVARIASWLSSGVGPLLPGRPGDVERRGVRGDRPGRAPMPPIMNQSRPRASS